MGFINEGGAAMGFINASALGVGKPVKGVRQTEVAKELNVKYKSALDLLGKKLHRKVIQHIKRHQKIGKLNGDLEALVKVSILTVQSRLSLTRS